MSKILFIKGVSVSYLRQILTLITGLISLPLLLNYFGTTNYGIWILIVGLAEYLNTISFGIPSAMVTLVAKTKKITEKYLILKKSFHMLFLITLICLLLFLGVLFFNDTWIISFLGNIKDDSVVLAKKMFIVFVIATLIRIPLNLYVNFFRGMALTYISELYLIVAILLNFFITIISVYYKLEIINYLIILLVGQLLLNIIAAFHVLFKYSYVNFERNTTDNVSNMYILKSSFAFFQVGLAVSLIWSTDNLIISHFMSPEYVTPYSIAFKIFMYTFMFSAIINGVISPIYGHLFAENDWSSINKYTNLIHNLLPIFGAIVWIFLLFFAKEIIILWTGKDEAFGGYFLIFAIGLYGYIVSFVNTYSTLINSLNFVHQSLLIVWTEAIVNLALSLILVQFFGLAGVAFGTVIAAFVVSFIFFPKLIKKLTTDNIVYDFKYTKKHFSFLVVPFICVSLLTIELSIMYKIILFLFMSLIYIFMSWKFLVLEDKMVLLSFIKKKKDN